MRIKSYDLYPAFRNRAILMVAVWVGQQPVMVRLPNVFIQKIRPQCHFNHLVRPGAPIAVKQIRRNE